MNDNQFNNAIKSKAATNAELVGDLIIQMQAMIVRLKMIKSEFDSATMTGNGREFDGACHSMQVISDSTELNGSWRHAALDTAHNNI